MCVFVPALSCYMEKKFPGIRKRFLKDLVIEIQVVNEWHRKINFLELKGKKLLLPKDFREGKTAFPKIYEIRGACISCKVTF